MTVAFSFFSQSVFFPLAFPRLFPLKLRSSCSSSCCCCCCCSSSSSSSSSSQFVPIWLSSSSSCLLALSWSRDAIREQQADLCEICAHGGLITVSLFLDSCFLTPSSYSVLPSFLSLSTHLLLWFDSHCSSVSIPSVEALSFSLCLSSLFRAFLFLLVIQLLCVLSVFASLLVVCMLLFFFSSFHSTPIIWCQRFLSVLYFSSSFPFWGFDGCVLLFFLLFFLSSLLLSFFLPHRYSLLFDVPCSFVIFLPFFLSFSSQILYEASHRHFSLSSPSSPSAFLAFPV